LVELFSCLFDKNESADHGKHIAEHLLLERRKEALGEFDEEWFCLTQVTSCGLGYVCSEELHNSLDLLSRKVLSILENHLCKLVLRFEF
jgi:hypothetical protein